MPMTPQQVELVQTSFKKVVPIAATAADLFYNRLFEIAKDDLGQRHKGYGMAAAHYAPVGAALLWTLEKGLGPDFTPEVKAAWNETYTALAGVMTA
jgi:hemoglobin-like flavoprotein